MQTVTFLIGIVASDVTTLKYANAHGPRFFTGYRAFVRTRCQHGESPCRSWS